MVGPPVEALRLWLDARRHRQGADLPRHRPMGEPRRPGLTPQAVNLIVKRRCAMAGLDPAEYSAHGLRAGYLTEAARCGVPLPRGHAAVAAPLRAAGGALLQRRRAAAGSSGAADRMISRLASGGVTIVAEGGVGVLGLYGIEPPRPTRPRQPAAERDFDEAPWRAAVRRVHDLLNILADRRPMIRLKYDDGDPSPSHVLLILQVLVPW